MKLRILLIFVLFVSSLLLQSCGSGGGGSDTNGVLTVSAPAVTGGAKVGDVATVTFTVTYTTPPGKSPNGLVIATKIVDASGAVVASYNTQLYSNNSYNDSFSVSAASAQQFYGIHLSIGSMTAGTSVVIPAGT